MRFSTVSLVAAFAATTLATDAYAPPPAYGAPAGPTDSAAPAAPAAPSNYLTGSTSAPYPTDGPAAPADGEECPEEGAVTVSDGTTYVWTTITTTVCSTEESAPTPASNQTSPEDTYPVPSSIPAEAPAPPTNNNTTPVPEVNVSGASRITLTTGALATVFLGVMYLL